MVATVIARALSAMGINRGDCVLAHTSLKSFGIRGMSPKYVCDALVMAVGSEGTVVLPSLSYLNCNKDNPVFDYKNTKSNIGVVPEYFRTQYRGVTRSMCPTHSCCAYGKNALEIVGEHHLDTTPCGPHSPFAKLRDMGGKIVFFGCGMEPNTSMHAVEELYTPDYLFGDVYEYTMIRADGSSYKQLCRAHDFRNTIQRYDRLRDLMPPDAIAATEIFDSETIVIDARTMWEVAGEYYSRDKHYFTDKY